ncbi:MAG: hypothetical protein IT373_34830 [Polyangiaceae bacterium]|nr:hypothetical protein [Polyangiaceae bacterium]
MLKRRTVLAIAKLSAACFEYSTYAGAGMTNRRHIRTDWLSDLLFEKEHDLVLVSAARALYLQPGATKEFVLGMYAGATLELLARAREQQTRGAGPVDRTALARELLEKLAADLLEYAHRPRDQTQIAIPRRPVAELLACLELDGYQWRGDRLLRLEQDTFEVKDQEGVIEILCRDLGLGGLAQVKHELKLTDEHYVGGRWGDCIKHARDLAECILLDLVTARAVRGVGSIPPKAREQAITVRSELHSSGFFDDKELGFMNALWKLLSEQGGHMNMSAQENARICRQYALTAAHFVLLRFQALHT